MRNAAPVLLIIRHRGARGLPLEQVYQHLYNRDLSVRAYGRTSLNHGAMTRGATHETADGMALAKSTRSLRPCGMNALGGRKSRRVRIPKKEGTTRPLGLPTWSDTRLQEVVRAILEAYDEPQFRPSSHGFRPGRGCHTALKEIERVWSGTLWWIEGDISKGFDRLDQQVLLSILGERSRDQPLASG